MDIEESMVEEIRRLIVNASPDETTARPVLTCDDNQPLDEVIPFSSLIWTGTLVALEGRYKIRITRKDLENLTPPLSLRQIAGLVSDLENRT